MRRVAAVATFLALLLSSTSAFGASALRHDLLSAKEMPRWSKYYLGAAQTASCPESTFAKPEGRSAQREVFVQTSSATLLLERVGTSADPAKAYDQLLAHVTKCPKTATTLDGHTTFQHLRPVRLGAFSVPVTAYTLAAVVGGANVSGVVAFARKGRVVLALAELSLFPLNAHGFKTLVAEALARIH